MKIKDIRLTKKGVTDSFEELSCQIFRRVREAPSGAVFRRVRGDGGDGGVEAYWRSIDGSVWGLQSKHFTALGASQKKQAHESLLQAVKNYPLLSRYTISLPITLTGKTATGTSRPRKGQIERIDEWIAEWAAELLKNGKQVKLEVWDESDLLHRLVDADPSGGMARYWFDKDPLSSKWFGERLDEAKAQAGPRYTPYLSIETPLIRAFAAFGLKEDWITEIDDLAKELREAFDRWKKSPRSLTSTAVDLQAVWEIVQNEGETACSAVETPEQRIEAFSSSEFGKQIKRLINGARELEGAVRSALLINHGENADTPEFRQYRAAYQADFPMQTLDSLRALIVPLVKIDSYFDGGKDELASAKTMVIRGDAGVGKTHAIIDEAKQRHERGLLSVVLFGEDAGGPDPWMVFLAKLGLASTGGPDAALDALDAAGEVSGYPLMIFIDALNETPNRAGWQSWLPSFVVKIKRRPNIKLCVSCREVFSDEVLASHISVATVFHNGFLGREYEAQITFFEYYGLKTPPGPLPQEEFANPLFLRLVCEALKDDGEVALPVGRGGFRAIVGLLLRGKNTKIARECSYDERENRVEGSLLALAADMAKSSSRTLDLISAKTAVSNLYGATLSETLFRLMEGESLISIIPHTAGKFGLQTTYTVRFSFERMGDHLIADYLLDGVDDVGALFEPGGPLEHLTVAREAAHPAGLLEALSIHLPEKYDVELSDYVDFDLDIAFYKSFLAGLQWRETRNITNDTKAVFMKALNKTETRELAIETLLGMATNPHGLNALFLDSILSRMPTVDRDPLWSHSLEVSFSGWSETLKTTSRVHRLIRDAHVVDTARLDEDTCYLWLTVLAWFCASPDRRIRDQATMAMAKILKGKPSTGISIIQHFQECDDEYIQERVLLAVYAGLLMGGDDRCIGEVARHLYDFHFTIRGLPLNVSIRDLVRLIIELAVSRGVWREDLPTDVCIPPYGSDWPISFPLESDVAHIIADQDTYPRLNITSRFLSDFSNYVLDHHIFHDFDLVSAKIDKESIKRWFMREVTTTIGYPGNGDAAAYDRLVLRTFGGGRGKPGWAERLGKKYYWILLRRLMGIFSDHLPRKKWGYEVEPHALQGFDIRDVDPTDQRHFQEPDDKDKTKWHVIHSYVHDADCSRSGDEAWIIKKDLLDLLSLCEICDDDGASWHVIYLSDSVDGRSNRDKRDYRSYQRVLHAVSCEVKFLDKFSKNFNKSEYGVNFHLHNDFRFYIAEYAEIIKTLELDDNFVGDIDGIAYQSLHVQHLRGREWEYDYGQGEVANPLNVPCPSIVRWGNLNWDGRGSWVDTSGVPQVIDIDWQGERGIDGLIARSSFLDEYLTHTQQALVISGFQAKMIMGLDLGQQMQEFSLLQRNSGATSLVSRRLRK